MGRFTLRVVLAMLVLIGASFAVSVSVSSPGNYSTTSSPATINAVASSSYPITGWHIYVDGRDTYAGPATRSIAAAVPMATGTHQVIVRAWDSTGAFGNTSLTLTIAAPTNGVAVYVSSPANGAAVASPATISASASSGLPITGWRIYVDGGTAYSGPATTSISVPVGLAGGTHQVVVRAWNTAGAFGSANLTLNVAGAAASGGPTPPANALAFTRLEEKGGWTSCSSASCSGGVSSAGSYWMAQYQSNPSLDGSSSQFFTSGSAYSTALWGLKAGSNAAPTHFIFDLWVYVDQNSQSTVQALEYDVYHVANGLKYMFGTECNYWTKTWDVWNEVSQNWVHSNAACNKFSVNNWHHIVWSMERVGAQTHYLSITVDGWTQNIAGNYAYQPAPATWWGNGDMGIHIQEDLSSAPGAGVHQWVDKASLYAW